MISTNALSLFLLKHDQNGFCNHNLCSIQESMRSYKIAVYKFKRVYSDSPNLALLTKSATPREVQVTYSHAYVGNKSLRETVTTFALAVLLEAPTVVTINAENDYSGAANQIPLSTTKLLLHTAIGDLSKSKKLRDWAALNAVFLPPLLAKDLIFEGEAATRNSSRYLLSSLWTMDRNPPPMNHRMTAQLGRTRRTPRMPMTK